MSDSSQPVPQSVIKPRSHFNNWISAIGGVVAMAACSPSSFWRGWIW
jgi:hypothetical protein